jgi:hypothetical protein
MAPCRAAFLNIGMALSALMVPQRESQRIVTVRAILCGYHRPPVEVEGEGRVPLSTARQSLEGPRSRGTSEAQMILMDSPENSMGDLFSSDGSAEGRPRGCGDRSGSARWSVGDQGIVVAAASAGAGAAAAAAAGIVGGGRGSSYLQRSAMLPSQRKAPAPSGMGVSEQQMIPITGRAGM